jgi:hypothetical protein
MELDTQLADFADRIQSACGPYINFDEVQQWPKGRLDELLGMDVVIKTTPATKIKCTQCSSMDCPPIEPSVETLPGATEPVGLFMCTKEGGGGFIKIPLERFKRWEIVAEKLKELNDKSQASETQRSNVKGMSWQEAQKKAEVLVDEKGYLGFGVLREAIGCSENTLRKAIKNSPELQEAKEDHESTNKKMKAVGLTAKVVETYESSAEPKLTESETEEIIAEMLKRIEDEKPEMLEKTKSDLEKMDIEGKQRFAAMYKRSYRKQKSAFDPKGPKKPIQYKQA